MFYCLFCSLNCELIITFQNESGRYLLVAVSLCVTLTSSRLQEEILQKEEAENNLAAFRAVSPAQLITASM